MTGTATTVKAKPKGERTCIGCGAKAAKQRLHRIVRAADGSVSYDPTGRAAGRGAYVCSQACLDAVAGTGKLQRALRAPLKREDAERVALEVGAACAEGKN